MGAVAGAWLGAYAAVARGWAHREPCISIEAEPIRYPSKR
jgi:hypothetical protein